MDRANLVQRVVTAVLLAPLLLALVVYAPSGVFAGWSTNRRISPSRASARSRGPVIAPLSSARPSTPRR